MCVRARLAACLRHADAACPWHADAACARHADAASLSRASRGVQNATVSSLGVGVRMACRGRNKRFFGPGVVGRWALHTQACVASPWNRAHAELAARIFNV